MTYSPDGDRLFTIGQDGHLRVHDVLQMYLPIQVLPIAAGQLAKVAMALSADARQLCTATKAQGQKFASLLLFAGKLCLALPCAALCRLNGCTTCTTLAGPVRCTHNTNREHSTAGAKLLPELKVDTETPDFVQLAFAPDGRSVWAATSDGKLERYCTASGELLTLINAGHQDDIASLSVHASGSFVLTGAHDKLLKLWDVAQYAPASNLHRVVLDAVSCCSITDWETDMSDFITCHALLPSHQSAPGTELSTTREAILQSASAWPEEATHTAPVLLGALRSSHRHRAARPHARDRRRGRLRALLGVQQHSCHPRSCNSRRQIRRC